MTLSTRELLNINYASMYVSSGHGSPAWVLFLPKVIEISETISWAAHSIWVPQESYVVIFHIELTRFVRNIILQNGPVFKPSTHVLIQVYKIEVGTPLSKSSSFHYWHYVFYKTVYSMFLLIHTCRQ